MKLLAFTIPLKKLRACAAAGAVVIALGGCGASDLAGLDRDTFIAQAMPTWIIPKLRDDYTGKSYIQPLDAPRPTAHNEQGEVVTDPPLWHWPRGWPWPWPLPYPSPAR